MTRDPVMVRSTCVAVPDVSSGPGGRQDMSGGAGGIRVRRIPHLPRLHRLYAEVRRRYIAWMLRSAVASAPASTVTCDEDSPSFPCQAFTVYVPGGTSASVKEPSAPVTA